MAIREGALTLIETLQVAINANANALASASPFTNDYHLQVAISMNAQSHLGI